MNSLHTSSDHAAYNNVLSLLPVLGESFFTPAEGDVPATSTNEKWTFASLIRRKSRLGAVRWRSVVELCMGYLRMRDVNDTCVWPQSDLSFNNHWKHHKLPHLWITPTSKLDRRNLYA